jgi:hypothetical protein
MTGRVPSVSESAHLVETAPRNVLTGLNVRDILELIDLLPPVRSGEGPQ